MERILCVNRLRFDFGVFVGLGFFFTEINISIFDLRLFENPLQCFVKANINVHVHSSFFIKENIIFCQHILPES